MEKDEFHIDHGEVSLFCWMQNGAYRVQMESVDEQFQDYKLISIDLTKAEATQLRDKLNELLGH